MRNRYINDITGKFGPRLYYQRRMHHDQIATITDKMIYYNKKSKVKQEGPREMFLKEYEKSGYESAKTLLDEKYGNIYTNEILINWLGINNLDKIMFNIYKEKNIEEAYKKAEEINRKIGYPVLKKDDIDNLINNREKMEKDRNEDDDESR